MQRVYGHMINVLLFPFKVSQTYYGQTNQKSESLALESGIWNLSKGIHSPLHSEEVVDGMDFFFVSLDTESVYSAVKRV